MNTKLKDTPFTPLWAYELLIDSVNLPSAIGGQKRKPILSSRIILF